MRRNAMRVCLWAFLGSLLLQAAWILALPPFRGMDEFDHAYRAAAVADGEWVGPGTVSASGRGELVRVPASIVEDARPACEDLKYTGRDNCNPVERMGDGEVTVASAASRYNPIFYWVIGTAAKPFEGATALYVMRAVTALLCSLLIAGAAWVTTRWSRTWWPLVGVAASLTPTAVYSTAVAAPNGIELTAAVGLWMALLGVHRVNPHEQRRLIVAAAMFALPLALVRGLGPLWLACILIVWVVVSGRRLAYSTIRRHRRVVGFCSAAVVTVTAAASLWTLVVGSMELEQHGPFPNALHGTFSELPIWFLQSIAAFPLRNEAAPMIVYATGGLALVALLCVGVVRSTPVNRAALVVALVLSLGIPFVLQLNAYETAGPIWQGRYGWPLSMGVLLLCAAALDEAPPRHRLVGPGLLCAAVAWGIAHTASTVSVALGQQSSLFADDPRWVTADGWMIGLLSALGVAAWTLMVRAGTTSPPSLATAAVSSDLRTAGV